MRRTRRISVRLAVKVAGAVIVLCLGVVATTQAGWAQGDVDVLEELSLVLRALAIYRQPTARLVDAAARAMVFALGDPYAGYMNEGDLASFKQGLEEEYEGMGVTLEVRGGSPVVVSTFPDSPAEQAGVLAGDRLLEVDGKPLKGMAPEAVAGLLRGPAGTPVRLLVMREGWEDPREIVVVREKIVIPSVESRMLGDG
ncbi:MAG: PDZ domain-containing protein, partial [Bacillota bacterium]|nr:PDZ domain-containing protein [Bacillota bacterium]